MEARSSKDKEPVADGALDAKALEVVETSIARGIENLYDEPERALRSLKVALQTIKSGGGSNDE